MEVFITAVIIGAIGGLLVYGLFPDRRYLLGTVAFGILGSFVGYLFLKLFDIGKTAYLLDPKAFIAIFSIWLITIVFLGFQERKKKI